jgi:hypothetical protein
VGHARVVQAGRAGVVPLSRERIWLIILRIIFLFFEWIQNLATFKILCKFGLKSEKYEINFLA